LKVVVGSLILQVRVRIRRQSLCVIDLHVSVVGSQHVDVSVTMETATL
jgi:hypothetical protein